MPSTISTSVSSAFASSTVMTPSLPTFCIAWAIILPTLLSPLDEIVPTCSISADEPTFFERFLISAMTAATARSMPRFRSIGFMPAATALAPSLTMAAASTVAVVVPSPASSLVFCATSRTICAPIFSNLSSSSISLATVTPSLVMRGAPKLFSITTLRPLGPSVTFTALASVSTPRSIRSRASPENRTSFADIVCLLLRFSTRHRRARPVIHAAAPLYGRPGRSATTARASGDHAHDVGFLHDQKLIAVELDLGAGPLAEQHAVAGLEVHNNELAVLVAAARSDGDDFAFLRFFFHGIRNDDAAFGPLVGLNPFDDDSVMQGTELKLCHDHPYCRVRRGVRSVAIKVVDLQLIGTRSK